MSIPGFYYDDKRKKYFRICSASDGHHQITEDHLKNLKAKESMECYQRSDPSIHLPQTLHKQEIAFHTKYNLKEDVIRSRLKPLKTSKTINLEVLDFCGNQLKDICVDSVTGSPKTDHLFAVMTGTTGAVIYQIPVDDLFCDDIDVNQTKRLMNAFPKPNRVIDISCINGANHDLLSTIVHHFPTPTTINTSFTLTLINGLSQTMDLSQTYEFCEPIFSATHFEDMNVLGAEKKVYVFKPSHSGKIRIIKSNDNITALKTSADGRLFITGSNRGQLSCFDVRENCSLQKGSQLSLHDKSVVFLHVLKDNTSVIASSHNNFIHLLDLRMFSKPVLRYWNHCNHCSKIGLSVEESLDLLCSSGDDNLVRFWSIKSGKLLHMYYPEIIDSRNHSLPSLEPRSHVWYSNSWKCLNSQSIPLLLTMTSNRLDVITGVEPVEGVNKALPFVEERHDFGQQYTK